MVFGTLETGTESETLAISTESDKLAMGTESDKLAMGTESDTLETSTVSEKLFINKAYNMRNKNYKDCFLFIFLFPWCPFLGVR